MEMSQAVVMDGEASGGGGGHAVIDGAEPVHACHKVAKDTSHGERQVYAPNPLGVGAEPWMHLRADRSGGLGRKHAHGAAAHRGKHGDGEEHDSQSAYPLRQRAPEEHGMV